MTAAAALREGLEEPVSESFAASNELLTRRRSLCLLETQAARGQRSDRTSAPT